MIDAFDGKLNKLASVLTRGTGPGDSYGQSDPAFTVIATNVPVLVALGKGRAKEWKQEKKVAKNYREIYMRPWYLDQAPDGSHVANHVVAGTTYNTQPLQHNYWLKIDGQFLNIFQIDDPGGQGHHLQVWCEIVEV